MRKNTRGSLIWLRMMRFTHQSNLLSNDFLKQFDLTTAQFDVLNQIDHFGPLTQSELAKHVTVTEGGISRMLSRLEKEHLIKREQSWKTKTISPTEKGEEKLNAAFDAQLDYQSAFFNDTLSEEEQNQIVKLMSKLQKYSEDKMRNI